MPSGNEARPLPRRAEALRLIDAWFVCHVGMDCSGRPYFLRLSNPRCSRIGGDRRILRRFTVSGRVARHRRGRFPTHDEYAYLAPTRRGWMVTAVPDADACDRNQPCNSCRRMAWRSWS